jgi:hypothetical protein
VSFGTESVQLTYLFTLLVTRKVSYFIFVAFFSVFFLENQHGCFVYVTFFIKKYGYIYLTGKVFDI